jgi:hypothetical protein
VISKDVDAFLPPTRVLKRFNNWLGAHGRVLLASVLEVAGVILVVKAFSAFTGAA